MVVRVITSRSKSEVPVWFHVFEFPVTADGNLHMVCKGCKKDINLSNPIEVEGSNKATCEIPYVPKYEGTEGLSNKHAALLVR